MAFNGKVVLFVEGEFSTPRPRTNDPLNVIWRDHLVKSLELIEIARIVPISKKNIAGMDSSLTLSGAGIVPLDELINVELVRDKFDVAVIAWDLLPPYDKNAQTCRWEETLWLYKCLATRNVLRQPWLRRVQKRYEELGRRPQPRRSGNPPRLQEGAVLAVCMEPTFESLLLSCEQAVRDALGVPGQDIAKWPRWDTHIRFPEELLQQAIAAARDVKPKPRAFRRIRGDMENAKNDWGEYFLRHIQSDPHRRSMLKHHSIAIRLMELLARNR